MHHFSINIFTLKIKNPIFGPQPYLAFRTKTGKYFHDNFDVMIPSQKFSYTLDFHTIDLSEVEVISAASSDRLGNISVVNLSL